MAAVMVAPPIDSSKLLADIVRSAFEHHKNHARFQEIQRRWLNVAFVTATGAILYFVSSGSNSNLLFADGKPKTAFWVCLAAHLALATLISLITTKHSGEFQRHFRRGDEVLTAVRNLYVAYFEVSNPVAPVQPQTETEPKLMEKLDRLFATLSLETSSIAMGKTDRRGLWGANFAKFISASRGTIYFYSAIIAFDVSLAVYFLMKFQHHFHWPPKVVAAIVFIAVFIVWSAVLVRFLRAVAGAGVSSNDAAQPADI